jgi:hypothetical protein
MFPVTETEIYIELQSKKNKTSCNLSIKVMIFKKVDDDNFQ